MSKTINKLLRQWMGLIFVIVFISIYLIFGGDMRTRILPDNHKEKRNNIDMISRDFLEAAFINDSKTVREMLSEECSYDRGKDGSSVVRYDNGKILVEGYMPTDKKLMSMRQRWYMKEDDGTYVSSMEIYVKGEPFSQVMNLYFKNNNGKWKLYMLENGI